MTDFQNWWDGYFHEINGQKETAQAAWQARGELDAVRIKEWQSLSDDEIGRLAVFDGLHHVEIPLLAKFILAIEQALKEKNND